MNDSEVLKVLIGVVVAGIFGLNVKIIWDWLCSAKNNKTDIDALKKETSMICEINKKTEKIHSALFGNGSVEKSIVYRVAAIEDFVKDIKKIKESRGL